MLNREGKTPPLKEREQKTVRSITKESDDREQTKEYETKLEQIVNAVKEGFKTQNDFLSNTLKGTNQEEQNTPVNQTQQTIMHQA